MDSIQITKTEEKTNDDISIRFAYDQEADILEIFFDENEKSTGVELTDHILLRLNKKTRRAVSVTLRHFSILTERTGYGPRSYPLNKLEKLPEDLRDLALLLLSSKPVNQFLKLSHFQESPAKQIPFTYVDAQLVAV